MSLIRSYTVSSLKDIELLPFLKRAQFTLNPRMSPQKRKTVEALKKLKKFSTEVYVHYDFLRTVPRYGLMTDYGKESMISEIADLILYSFDNSNLKGIIIHMDTAFRKEMIKDLSSKSFDEETLKKVVMKHIASPMYKSKEDCANLVWNVFNKEIGDSEKNMKPVQRLLHRWYVYSTNIFYADLLKAVTQRLEDISLLTKPHAVVFLENTTHITTLGLNPQEDIIAGSVKHNAMLTVGKSALIGVCWDLEHAFAANDIDMSEKNLASLYAVNNNVLIHLNCIEEGVKRGSMKDRHSKTTVFNCSQYEFEYYKQMIEMLDALNVPYIREVKSETMEEEIQQCKLL